MKFLTFHWVTALMLFLAHGKVSQRECFLGSDRHCLLLGVCMRLSAVFHNRWLASPQIKRVGKLVRRLLKL